MDEQTTFSKVVEPSELFKALILGGYGRFHISGITLKKSIFKKSGLFDENLHYAEDTELWYKISLVGNLMAGSICNPVSIRWVHERNTIHDIGRFAPAYRELYEKLFYWGLHKPFSFEVKNLLFNAFYENVRMPQMSPLVFLKKQVNKKPSLIFTTFFIKKMHLNKLNSESKL